MENIFHPKKISEAWVEHLPGKNMAFKYHLVSYLLMNVFFWLGWLSYGSTFDLLNGLPWPIYPMFFGAVGLICHFMAIFLLNEKNRN